MLSWKIYLPRLVPMSQFNFLEHVQLFQKIEFLWLGELTIGDRHVQCVKTTRRNIAKIFCKKQIRLKSVFLYEPLNIVFRG
jgi:hypothetical protein